MPIVANITGPQGPPGTGGITGPSVTTFNAIVLWNSATGTVVENSTVLVDAAGYVYGTGFVSDNNLATGVTLTIAPAKQMIAVFDYFLRGDMKVQGSFIII